MRASFLILAHLTVQALVVAPLVAQNDQATDVSGTAAGSTVAGGTFSPSGTNPVSTAQTVAAVATAGQSMTVAMASGTIPGFSGNAGSPAVQAVVSLISGGAAGGGAAAPGSASPQQTVQNEMVGGLGLPAAQVAALLTAVEGLLPTPQPAELQRAVAAWNDLCRATPPGNLTALASGDAPQAIRAVLAGLVAAAGAAR